MTERTIRPNEYPHKYPFTLNKKLGISWNDSLVKIPKELIKGNQKVIFNLIREILEKSAAFFKYFKLISPKIFWVGKFVRKLQKGAGILIFPESFFATFDFIDNLSKLQIIFGNIDNQARKVQKKWQNRGKKYISRYSKFCNKEICQIKIDLRIKAFIALGSSAMYLTSCIPKLLIFFAGAGFFLTGSIPTIKVFSAFFLVAYAISELAKTSTKLSKLSKKITQIKNDEKITEEKNKLSKEITELKKDIEITNKLIKLTKVKDKKKITEEEFSKLSKKDLSKLSETLTQLKDKLSNELTKVKDKKTITKEKEDRLKLSKEIVKLGKDIEITNKLLKLTQEKDKKKITEEEFSKLSKEDRSKLSKTLTQVKDKLSKEITQLKNKIQIIKAPQILYYQKTRSYVLCFLQMSSLFALGMLGIISYMVGLPLSLLVTVITFTAIICLTLDVIKKRSNSVTKKLKDQHKNDEKNSNEHHSECIIKNVRKECAEKGEKPPNKIIIIIPKNNSVKFT